MAASLSSSSANISGIESYLWGLVVVSPAPDCGPLPTFSPSSLLVPVANTTPASFSVAFKTASTTAKTWAVVDAFTRAPERQRVQQQVLSAQIGGGGDLEQQVDQRQQLETETHSGFEVEEPDAEFGLASMQTLKLDEYYHRLLLFLLPIGIALDILALLAFTHSRRQHSRCNERSSGSHGRLFVRLLQLLAVTDALFLLSLLALTLLHSAAHAEVVLLRTRRRALLLAYAIGPLALPVLISAFMLARNWVVAAIATYRWELICVSVPQRASSRIFGGVRRATLLWLSFVALALLVCLPRLQERVLKVERTCDADMIGSESGSAVASPTAVSTRASLSDASTVGGGKSIDAHVGTTNAGAENVGQSAENDEYEVLGLSFNPPVRGSSAYTLWVLHHKVFLFMAQTGIPLLVVVFMNARIVYRLLHAEHDFGAFDENSSMSSYQRLQRRLRRMRNSRSTRIVILLSVIFAALELPAVASKLMNDAFSNVHSMSLHSLHLAANLCTAIDSLINFIAYLSANRSFHRALRHQVLSLIRCDCCLCCCCRCGAGGYGDRGGGGRIAACCLRRGSSEFLRQGNMGGRSHRSVREVHSFTDSSVIATPAAAGNRYDTQLSTFSWLLRTSQAAPQDRAERNKTRYSTPDLPIELQIVQQE